ncbi:activating transcription factor 7-interacting protein 1-like isoform X1 [Daphnia pulicaria]|uniref:activating transcription factor 7-interacting protein 1-like isoform X1 n=1 Tax=Daphnia pulicaria TaxID=35523 RepID=UPI001EEB721F|nr:activating transcription factor 7-interacting protein 1-like isoform X1 [Daphnia pulicaria]
MVDDGRKVDHPDQVILETTTTATVNPSLKLKINLRDRQAIRKRHRSSSPTNSSDSSSTHGSTRSSSRHHSSVSAGSIRASSLKRNRKDNHQRRHADADEPSTQTEDTPPPSSNVGSPTVKTMASETDGNRHNETRKVRVNSGLTESVATNSSERKSKSKGSPESVMSSILLVDMNGESTSPIVESQIVDPSGSPPESPLLLVEEDKSEIVMKSLTLEAKVGNTAGKIVKRLTREELERLVMEQMCLAIRERGVTGELERKLEAADAQLERYRRRSEALHKQVSDLELVVRRFVSQQSKNRNQVIAPPMKMTRSVGLQINLSSHPSIAHQIAALKKTTESSKPAVSIVPALTIKSPTHPSQSVATSSGSTMTSPNSVANSLARVPIPPSFTMQSPDIASYVPQQAVPRYRAAPTRRSDEPPNSSKIATYVNIGGLKSIPGGASVASKLLKNSVNITPVIPLATKQQPNQVNPNPGTAAVLVRARSATTGDPTSTTSAPPSIPASVPMARWSKVPASRATTVNKVTLPGRLPNVIDLTDEDLEKERAAAAAGRLVVPRQMPKATSATVPNGFPSGMPNGVARGVALKSTTLNGRSPVTTSKSNGNSPPAGTITRTHPAPLPPPPIGPLNPAWKAIAPKPTVDIKRVANGIVLSWTMHGNLSNHADIASYQLFAYQEGANDDWSASVWKRVGDVKALPLPMACTLTQFLEGHRYHFAVRAMDVHGRYGPYSEPGTIFLN